MVTVTPESAVRFNQSLGSPRIGLAPSGGILSAALNCAEKHMIEVTVGHPEEVKTMQHRSLWPAIGGVGLALVTLGSIWAFGGYDGASFAALTLGVIAPIAVGIGFAALIFYGRRSRRDEAVDRTAHNDNAG
jgi:hypothetical protein